MDQSTQGNMLLIILPSLFILHSEDAMWKRKASVASQASLCVRASAGDLISTYTPVAVTVQTLCLTFSCVQCTDENSSFSTDYRSLRSFYESALTNFD